MRRLLLIFMLLNVLGIYSQTDSLTVHVEGKPLASLLTDEQKQDAVDTMVQMTGVAEKETAAEILLQAKGFDDVVVSINEDAVDVVVNMAELTDIQRAQIEDIVKRKTQIGAENIIISTVSQQ